MSKTIPTILFLILITSVLPAQTLTQRRFTVSSGGGRSTDGTFTNQVVIGQTSYGESEDSVFTGGGGFLGGGDDWMTPIEEEAVLPLKFELSQNYPNPFNPSTTIQYSLANPSHVRIDVYNILGQRTAVLVNETKEAGNHSLVWNAGEMPSGMYFYRIKAGDFEESKKMLLLK